MNKITLFLLLSILFFTSQAQRYWTLDECVNTGLNNNISLQQKSLSKESAEADYYQSKMNLLPSLNASASNNWNIGFAINPVTNIATQDVTFRNNNFGINSSWVLFSGLQNTRNTKLQKTTTKAFDQDYLSTKNNIALQICNAFLQALLNFEIMESRKLQLATTKLQLDKQEKLYELGGSSRTKYLQLKAQYSNEELQLVLAENQLSQSYLNLWQSMNILPDTVNKVKKPDADITKVEDELKSADEIFQTYVQNSPEIKAAELRSKSAELSKSIAVGGHSPRITFNAGINSFYSTQSLQGSGTPTTTLSPIGVDINGNSVFAFRQSYPQSEVIPFSTQFDRNLGKNFGLTLAVPIFNGWQTNTNVKKQTINLKSAELNEQQVRNDAYKSVNQAYLDFKSAQKKYESNVNNLDANKESASLAEAQFSLGAIGINDYLQTKNAFLQAETNYLQAKYELVFRRKVLDFYLGKPLY